MLLEPSSTTTNTMRPMKTSRFLSQRAWWACCWWYADHILLVQGLAQSYGQNKGIATGPGPFSNPSFSMCATTLPTPTLARRNTSNTCHFCWPCFLHLFLNILVSPWRQCYREHCGHLARPTFLITNLPNKRLLASHFWPLGRFHAFAVPCASFNPIEVLGIFIKPFSLLIRLYANMQAGHIVLMSLIGLMFIFKSWIEPLSFVGFDLVDWNSCGPATNLILRCFYYTLACAEEHVITKPKHPAIMQCE